MKFLSFLAILLAFTFHGPNTTGQTGENVTQTTLVSESNPFFTIESIRETRETRDKKISNSHIEQEDNPVRNKRRPNAKNETHEESTKNIDGNNEDGSWSTSSSEESENSTPNINKTNSRSRPNGSSVSSDRKVNLIKSDIAKLEKQRDPRKDEKYHNRHTVNNSSGDTGSEIHPLYKQRERQQAHSYYVAEHADLDKSLVIGNRPSGSKQRYFTGEHEGSLTVGASSFYRDNPDLGILGTNIQTNSTHGHHKNSKNLFGSTNVLSGKSERKHMELLINRTSRYPFSVERPANRQIDPNVYTFFQYMPPRSIGMLWSQKAGLGTLTPGGGGGGIHGGNMLEIDNGPDEDHLDPANIFDWEFKRYDRACLYVEYLENKAQLNSSQVSEETTLIVDGQNEKLARRFLDWQFVNNEDLETIALKGEGNNHPHYLTYKFLTMTVEIFRDRICRNATPYASAPEVRHFAPADAPMKAESRKKYLETKLLPKSFIDDLYRLFLTLRDITLPRGVPDYPTKKDEEDIYTGFLESCLKRDPIQWFSHTCADQVLSYDDPHNYACTPLVEYDFNYKEYDPIIDGMWHIFAAVHAFCFDEFNKMSLRFWHKYSMIILNSFTEGMRIRWKASIAEPKFYVRLLGPDYKTHFETMNRCMFAASLKSGAPYVLPRFLSTSPIAYGKERTMGKDAFENHPEADKS